jgi:hypothetical protein
MSVWCHHSENQSESSARIGGLSDVLFPDLEFHVLAHTSNMLAGEWAIPRSLVRINAGLDIRMRKSELLHHGFQRHGRSMRRSTATRRPSGPRL